MSIFSFITEKLGIGSAAAEEAPNTEPSAPTVAPVEVSDTAQPAPVLSSTISVVDVVSKLEGLSASHAEKLNWKVSIVDFLKLLGLDSSLTARKELAKELGCPAEKMGDSAQMNIWLHKTVLQKLAQNGGNIPPDLLN
ncbi:MAG: DUF3597 domain-containing protein [Methylococcaceae bacterium]|nr:DUF3597 domain-containing protein [Methylococcaceae bacterium]MDD1609259.1 DUF3597 domain-containing protein [Methylococcaceae bacterium]MDD1615402.1 DUF3597 domain-containing protein [Methylococcaceae bacterium]OYV20403.1 MAG: hypothetical protein CG439_483 [Methylococcaceae bacterium NSP1-2]